MLNAYELRYTYPNKFTQGRVQKKKLSSAKQVVKYRESEGMANVNIYLCKSIYNKLQSLTIALRRK
jgi:hypothetical protein